MVANGNNEFYIPKFLRQMFHVRTKGSGLYGGRLLWKTLQRNFTYLHVGLYGGFFFKMQAMLELAKC